MISRLAVVLALLTVATAQDCGGDPSLGCMDDTECTVGTCVRAAPADFLGCCTAPTTTTAPAAATTTVATSTSTCADLLNPQTGVSDCPARAYLCMMRQQCPRTCNFCSGTSTGTGSTSCVDLTNPSTGVSDCPARRAYCTNAVYTSLMRTQCPATCGFCTGSGTSSVVTGGTSSGSSTSCVDLKNPNTGVSDCPNMRGYCTNAVYTSLMRTQCPATCGFCTSG